MNILKVSLVNFLSFTKAVLRLRDDVVYLVSGENKITGGSNGSGKSSLAIDSITYALYGEARKGLSADELIKDGENVMTASIVFVLNGSHYGVRRTRERDKKTILEFVRFTKKFEVDEVLTRNTIKLTQEEIIKLVGVDYKTFVSTVFFMQGEADAFSKLTPKDAKSMVMSILQLNKYSVYCVKAKECLNGFKQERFDLGSKLEAHEEQLEGCAETTIESTSKETLLGLKKLYQQLNISQKNVKQELEVARANDKKYNENVAKLKGERSSIKMRYDKLKKLKNTCPTCEGPIDKKRLDAALKVIDMSIKKIDKDVESLKGKYVSKVDKLRTKIDTGDEELFRIKERGIKLKAQQEAKAKEAQRRADLKTSIKGFKSKLKSLDAEVCDYTELVAAFGANGIPAYIIDNVVPEFESVANDIISKLTDGRISLSINTQRNLKSGKTAETLEIIVHNLSGSRSYFSYSGGERMQLDFALRVALSVILCRRSNAKLETLVIDEGFGALDAGARQKLVKIIMNIKEICGFCKILVITHAEDVQEQFSNVISVCKTKDGSFIRK